MGKVSVSKIKYSGNKGGKIKNKVDFTGYLLYNKSRAQ